MKLAIVLSLVLALAATCLARPSLDFNPILMYTQMLRAGTMNCESWRLAVETDNAGPWKVVPEECTEYVKNYMTGQSSAQPQYIYDLNTVTMYASLHLNGLSPSANGKDIWVFDLDQTLLDDLPYYSQPEVNFGGTSFNRTKYYAWLTKGEQPALTGVQKLYNEVLKLGFKIVIISGTSETYRPIREANLKNVGYSGWERLILKKESERGTSAEAYKTKKRTELVEEGYKIVGNVGDQWSDLDGENSGLRIFKLPNSMYHVA